MIFVGHSVSAMIGVLAANGGPGAVRELVLVGPSPRYIDDEGYTGGFTRRGHRRAARRRWTSNYLGWSSAMAPAIMGNADRPELGEELTNSFCRTDPDIARQFARVTFLSDNREDLARARRADAGPPVLGRHHRAAGRRGVRPRAECRQHARRLEATRPLPEPERAGRDDRRDQRLPLSREPPTRAPPPRSSRASSTRTAPAGYLSLLPDGTIVASTGRCSRRPATRRDELVGRKSCRPAVTRRADLLRDPLERRRSSCRAGARRSPLELVCADGERLPVLLNSTS